MREQILRWLCVFIFSWLHRTGADGICSVPDSPARAHIYSCAICYQLKLAESRLHHLRDRNISESCFGHSSPSTLLLREFLDNYSTRLYRKLVAIFTFCWEKSISTSGWPNERVPVISIYFQFITQRRSASLFFTAAVVVDGLFIFVLWECCRLLRSSAEKRQIYDPTDWEESWEVAVDSTFRAKKSGGPSSLATRSPGVDELDIPLRFSTLLLHFFACLLAFDAIWSLHHFAEIHQLARFSAVILPGKTTVEGNSQEGLVYNTGGNNYNSTRFSHFRVAPIARAGAYPRKESRMTWFKSRKDWQREREGGKKGKDFCPIRTNARHCLSAISLFSSSSFRFRHGRTSFLCPASLSRFTNQETRSVNFAFPWKSSAPAPFSEVGRGGFSLASHIFLKLDSKKKENKRQSTWSDECVSTQYLLFWELCV